MAETAPAPVVAKRFDSVSPFEFFFKHDKGVILPEQIADQFYDILKARLPVQDEELFKFAIAELVSNCYFSPVEKLYRTKFENLKDIKDRLGVLATLQKNESEHLPRESLRLDLAEGESRLSFWILSDVMPESASLERIRERLAWDEMSAVEFIQNQSDSGGREYVSMTGAAGFGIYMAKKEFASYGGDLTFVTHPAEGWSGYQVAFPKPIQYKKK